MPSGSGRKPKSMLALASTRLHRAVPLPPAPRPEELEALRVPPADLTAGEQKAWLRLAPMAIERGTLVPATVEGFSELCTRVAQCEALDAMMGIGDLLEGLAVLRERRGWATLLGASLKDFSLTAFGRPATSNQVAPKENPFAIFGVAK